ncbi:TM2 domain-containing protein [Dokdonia sp. Hel_I_63]|uniref:TM2 domain-containing protein n=1 Tax=unclassified Dokdonia TaxID=2615033 RepID=UPI00020A6819|nr:MULTISPECIES: TM2 domain-containing protein [unclassified Dokdonia]AEE18963.1 hypothetical protein Krodi_0979 [Dokdonia sp. 4H-3-7-5]TVZ21810.1 TM2 domain-containing protein [Dokdonia sp. Hel_I_63]
MSLEDEKIPGDKPGNDAKNMADDAKKAASNFANEAKDTANEFGNSAKEEWNKVNTGVSNKVLIGIMGIIFGYLGIHKFMLGYTKEGLIQLGATIVTCGAAGIVGFIEGIIYLTKSDEDFHTTYVVNKKSWF